MMSNRNAGRLIRITSVKVLSGYSVQLGLTDGSTKEVDLRRYLNGPIFHSIRSDRTQFAAVKVDPRAGTIVWPNGADIDPDVLVLDLEPAPAESHPIASR
jgi:hypothetical protein